MESTQLSGASRGVPRTASENTQNGGGPDGVDTPCELTRHWRALGESAPPTIDLNKSRKTIRTLSAATQRYIGAEIGQRCSAGNEASRARLGEQHGNRTVARSHTVAEDLTKLPALQRPYLAASSIKSEAE